MSIIVRITCVASRKRATTNRIDSSSRPFLHSSSFPFELSFAHRLRPTILILLLMDYSRVAAKETFPPEAAAAAANNSVGGNGGSGDVCSVGAATVVGQLLATP